MSGNPSATFITFSAPIITQCAVSGYVRQIDSVKIQATLESFSFCNQELCSQYSCSNSSQIDECNAANKEFNDCKTASSQCRMATEYKNYLETYSSLQETYPLADKICHESCQPNKKEATFNQKYQCINYCMTNFYIPSKQVVPNPEPKPVPEPTFALLNNFSIYIILLLFAALFN